MQSSWIYKKDAGPPFATAYTEKACQEVRNMQEVPSEHTAQRLIRVHCTLENSGVQLQKDEKDPTSYTPPTEGLLPQRRVSF